MRSTLGLVSSVLLALQASVYAAVLVDFQVAQPPPLPKNAKQCTHLLIEYVNMLFPKHSV